MEHYFVFLLTALAAAILPGADFAVVTKNTLAGGSRGGQATALGVGSGLLMHTTAVVLGLSAVISQSAALFEMIKYAGAAYLFYLGIKTFAGAKQSKLNMNLDDAGAQAAGSGWRRYYLQGVLANLLNPKASVFYLTLLPQFVSPGGDPITQLILLGLTMVVVVTSWFLLLAKALSRIRAYFEKPAFLVSFQRATGSLLILCGIKLASAVR